MCSQPTLRRRSPGGTCSCPGSLLRRSMVLSTPPRLVAWTMTRTAVAEPVGGGGVGDLEGQHGAEAGHLRGGGAVSGVAGKAG
jgi:hypothetical protein